MRAPALLLLLVLALPATLAASATLADPVGDQGARPASRNSIGFPGAPLACSDGATDITGLTVESADGFVTFRVDVADLGSPGVVCGDKLLPTPAREAVVWADAEYGLWVWKTQDGSGVVACPPETTTQCALPPFTFTAADGALTWRFPVAGPADASCGCPAWDVAGLAIEAHAQTSAYVDHDPWSNGIPTVEVVDRTGLLPSTL